MRTSDFAELADRNDRLEDELASCKRKVVELEGQLNRATEYVLELEGAVKKAIRTLEKGRTGTCHC